MGDEELRRRVERLEEAHLYADRAVEELNRSVLDLAQRLEGAIKRVTALERRLEAGEEGEEEPNG